MTPNQKESAFSRRLSECLRGYGSAPLIEFDGRWFSGNDVLACIDRVDALLVAAGVSANIPVALVVRNRPAHAAVILGLLARGRSFSMIYAFQSPTGMAADVETVRPAVVIADRQDWTREVVEAAERLGCCGVMVSFEGPSTYASVALSTLGAGPFAPHSDEPAVAVLTSGTTGAPKRVAIRMPVLERGAISASSHQLATADEPPDLVFWPFGGIGGLCQRAGVLYAGTRMVLLEKFTVGGWAAAISRYGITRVAVQPAVVRMVLEAQVPVSALSSLQFIFGGSAAIDPDTQEQFERRYGLPIIWAYGATEFAGTLLSWTPDLYRDFGSSKRGSVGRAVPNTEVRVVDPDSGAPLGPGEQGYLEAHIPLIGPDWIRTTDLASIDSDGFVTLHGRGDGAINRGGFKVLPETVVAALQRHPAVLEAAVIGLADDRLGEVPVAVVETVAGFPAPSEHELREFVREHLPAPHVPVQVKVIDQLPRTPSLKVSLTEVRQLFD